MTEIFAIANSKGGCGKTTTAIHLAEWLAQKNIKVLLIDFDPQAHSSMSFLQKNYKPKEDMADLLFNEKSDSLAKAVVEINSSLSVLPCGISLAGIEQKLHGQKNREFRLKEKLRGISDEYSVILIDCPPQLGLLTINALLAASKVIVPVDSSIFALKGVEQSLHIFQLLAKKLKHELDYRILFTHFIQQSPFCAQILKKAQKQFQDKLFENKIPYSMLFKQAIGANKRVWELQTKSQAATQYRKFAEEFLKWSDLDVNTMQQDETENIEESSNFGKGIKISRNKVEFVYYGLQHTEIQIIGDFNNWLPDQHSLKFDPKKKNWKTQLKLDRGNYQYQYVVDGKIIPDPENPVITKNPEGEKCSMLEIG